MNSVVPAVFSAETLMSILRAFLLESPVKSFLTGVEGAWCSSQSASKVLEP